MKVIKIKFFFVLILISSSCFADHIDSSQIYLHLAKNQFENNFIDKALTSTYNSIRFKKQNHNFQLIKEYVLLSDIYASKGIYESSIVYLDSAEAFYKNKKRYIRQYAEVLLNKGRMYKRLDKYTDALDYFNKSYLIYNKLNDTLNLGNVYMNFGNVFKNVKKYDDAKENYTKALNKFLLLNKKKILQAFITT